MSSVVRQKGEGAAYWMLGGLYEVLMSSEDTGGRFTLMQFTIPARAPVGAPPHIHHDADETVHVLEGSGRFHIGDETVDVAAGGVLHFPMGTLEWFENPGDSPLKLVVTYAPGGTDKFFAEVGEPAPTRTLPPPMEGPPDMARLVKVGNKYGLELRMPPSE